MTLPEYYKASIAFKLKNKKIERRKRFVWAFSRVKGPKLHDGYCYHENCRKRKAAAIGIFGDVPKYFILSNYCHKHTDRDIF